MKKRMLAMLMCVAMALSLLPMTALAAEDDVLYVGGTNVISGGYWKGDGDGGLTEGSEDDYTVRYEPNTQTLTLRNAEISEAHLERTIKEKTRTRWNDEDYTEWHEETGYQENIKMYGIYSSSELNLCLEGTNTIALEEIDSSISEAPTDRDFIDIDLLSYGIYACEEVYREYSDGSGGYTTTELLPITISGAGSCSVSAGEIDAQGMATVQTFGLRARGFTVNSGELTFSGGSAVGGKEDPTLEKGSGNVYTTGISTGNITINNGSVVALGGTAQGGSETMSRGITYSSINMNGGSLEARGGSISGDRGTSIGIDYGSVTLNGGVVKAFGGKVTAGTTAGIRTGASLMGGGIDMKINAGTLIAAAGENQDVDGEKYAVQSLATTITPTVDYWWRTAETDDYTNGAETPFALAEGQTYVDITTTDPSVDNTSVLYVGGTNVIGGGYWKGDGAGGLTAGSESDYTVWYEPSTNMLTLKDASITKAFTKHTVKETTGDVYDENGYVGEVSGYWETIEMCGIYSSLELNLCLEGTNTIALEEVDSSISEAPSDQDVVDIFLDSYGIYACKEVYEELNDDSGEGYITTELCPITISGSGSCAISAGQIDARGMNGVATYGLYAKDLIINNSKLTISGGSAVGVEEGPTLGKGGGNVHTFGIYANSVTINNASVVADGGTAQGSDINESYGVCGKFYMAPVTLNGGSLEARGGAILGTYGSSMGIGGYVNLNGGVVKAFGGTVTAGETAGIITGGSSLGGSIDMKINAGTLIAAAGENKDADGEKYAVYYRFTTITPPDEYWWRTAETDDYTNGAETAFVLAEGQTYVEVTSVDPAPDPEPAPKHTISVINGSADSSLAEAGTTVTITAAEKNGYTFRNWEVVSGAITLADANKKVTTFTMPEENVTVKAVFEEDKPAGSSHGGTDVTSAWKVSVASGDHGSVSVSPSSAKQGNTVKVTVYPDKDYALDKLTVTDKNGSEIKLIDQGNGTYTFTMPASNVSIAASFTALDAPAPDLPFTDVTTSDWFYDGVAYVVSKGMMKGVSDAAFAPNATTTRGMLVTILYRLEGEPAANDAGFTDVESGAWYQEAVDWAAANGIVNGTTETTFDPNGTLTREQMAAILYRYAAYKGYDVSQKAQLDQFQDQSAVSGYAEDALAWANAAGLITGVTDTTLSPKGSAVRAQTATILMRFCESVVK